MILNWVPFKLLRLKPRHLPAVRKVSDLCSLGSSELWIHRCGVEVWGSSHSSRLKACGVISGPAPSVWKPIIFHLAGRKNSTIMQGTGALNTAAAFPTRDGKVRGQRPVRGGLLRPEGLLHHRPLASALVRPARSRGRSSLAPRTPQQAAAIRCVAEASGRGQGLRRWCS